MRRHYANYFRAMEGIKHFRSMLVTESNPAILFEILDQIESQYASQLMEAV